jgi:hypothetical protein
VDIDTREQLPDGPVVPISHHRVGFTGILSDELGHVWKDVRPMLERALAPNETTDRILTRLFLGSMQLWVAVEDGEIIAAMTTEIIYENDRKIANLCHVGGTGLNNWLGYIATVEEWAKANNCAAVQIARGRMGWLRILKTYKPRFVTLEKEL